MKKKFTHTHIFFDVCVCKISFFNFFKNFHIFYIFQSSNFKGIFKVLKNDDFLRNFIFSFQETYKSRSY